jgi:hypothetical protein
VVIQTGGLADLTLWGQFAASTGGFPHWDVFRDNSVRNVLARLVDALPGLTAGAGYGWFLARWLWFVAVGAVFLWMIRRALRRRQAAGLEDEERPAHWLIGGGDAMDALAFVLLASPLVWEHHYLLAVPVFVWCVATCPRRVLLPVLGAGALIFLPPTYDVLLLSFNRLAGLLLLLALPPVGEFHLREDLLEDIRAAWRRYVDRGDPDARPGE